MADHIRTELVTDTLDMTVPHAVDTAARSFYMPAAAAYTPLRLATVMACTSR
ncbi:hypothetical protein AB0C34_29020 [Nocardia sp. NPDC049220]|uniref:hypothetical protein n=1 Tax=Nocardia sp. NPDC049220 TaxID=3155273 RepID=UPI0033C435E4